MLIEEEGYYPLRIDARGAVVVRHNRWRRKVAGAAHPRNPAQHVSHRVALGDDPDGAHHGPDRAVLLPALRLSPEQPRQAAADVFLEDPDGQLTATPLEGPARGYGRHHIDL
jgi:hypothetical protein